MFARPGLVTALRQPLRRLAPGGLCGRPRAVVGVAPAPQAYPQFVYEWHIDLASGRLLKGDADMCQQSVPLGTDGHNKVPHLHAEGHTRLGPYADQGYSDSITHVCENEEQLATPGVGQRGDRTVETAVTEQLQARYIPLSWGSSGFLTGPLESRARCCGCSTRI